MSSFSDWRFWGFLAAISAGVGTVFSQVSPDPDARPASCPDIGEQSSDSHSFDFSRGWVRGRRSCMLNVRRSQLNGAADERMFHFYDDGLILIYTPMNGQEYMSVSAYYVFPLLRRREVAFDLRGNDLAIRLPSGGEVVFSGSNAAVSTGGGLRSQGEHLEISGFDRGVVLFLGTHVPAPGRHGTLPHMNRQGLATFIDRSGRQCVVSNSEVFDYDSRPGSVILRSSAMSQGQIQGDINGAIRGLLEARCPPDFEAETVPYYTF